MALIAVVITLEKLAPSPELIARISGSVALLLGAAMMLCRF